MNTITLTIYYNIRDNVPPGEKNYSHTYQHTYEPTRFFCPNCGNKDHVWRETGSGDYYLGVSYYCLMCDHAFYLPDEPYAIPVGSRETDRQILNGLKENQ